MRQVLNVLLGLAALACLAFVPAAGAKTVWLCKPGLKSDPCTSSMTATVELASGASGTQHASPARKPKIDCFYVYPTVSGQPGVNANRHIDPEEIGVAINQASRFSQACRVYAPMYRQLTTTGILGKTTAAQRALAYNDVLAAWHDYLKHFNKGRGVVLIGHSQGAFVLDQLVKDEVDKKAGERKRLVSALLIGGNIQVPVGKRVGGDFKHVPACASGRQNDCVVAYSTFDTVPPADALFGRVPGNPKRQVLCVNPASLSGDHGKLLSYFTTSPEPGPLSAVTTPQFSAPTPWVFVPNFYTAKCMNQAGASWLQIDNNSGPSDPRPVVPPSLGPTWGLHLADMQLAMGNLLDLVKLETKAYLKKKR
ncbi:MAG TPA: DUF3089 domain-containing protein [Thermoleophilaceae bacterium]